MTAKEAGFLLLSSKLGNPNRRCLTTVQLRTLADRVQNAPRSAQDRELEAADLMALGYGVEMAGRILALLDEDALLNHYMRRGEKLGCVPVSRVNGQYPRSLRRRLALESPGCLWAKGDLSLLDTPMISLVGSRELDPVNREFAAEVGRQAAVQGYTLVSGNARGADKTAQNACLAAGGRVISVVADELWQHPMREGILYLSEDGFDDGFSAQRALSRNRVIHALGSRTFVAQSGYQSGGTWDGTVKNLRFGWSPVFCFDDGSPATALLEQMGANLLGIGELRDFERLQSSEQNFLDR